MHGHVLLSLVLAGAAAAAPIAWEFEAGETGWRGRAESVKVERVPGPGATPESRGCLRVQGALAEGHNYAISDSHPMKGGGLYRLTAWVRVDRLGAGTPAPYLKCEFVAADEATSPGRANTESYDTTRLGTWQRLAGEFRAPDETVRCWLALEKGTADRAEVDAYLDDVRIEPISRLSALDRYRLDPLPAPLQARRGVHPRLYLDAERVAALRTAITGTHAELWREVKEQADRSAASGPPAYRETPDGSGNEQLWQRSVGNAMPPLAMAWALTGDRKYLDAAGAWARASCGYRTWGLGSTDGMDLAAGHQMVGLALIYDWCYRDLDEATRTTIRETLVRRVGAMFEAAASGKAWWQRSYLQNHLWVNITGMAAAGLALYDEVPDAHLWIGLPLEKYRTTMRSLGADGASHEGVGYWQYGVEYLLKFMHLSRELLGVDLYDHPWWRNTAAYPLYLSLPRAAWTTRSSIVDLADCPRSNWYGPDYLLRALAHEYRDGHAQWLAAQIDEANTASGEARWLNLIWFDPAVPARPPDDLPTLRHFDDMEIVSARSGWSGDESLVVFKCGPFIGHHGVQSFAYDPGGGHVHPDANHFVLFGAGEWLIRDDGYRDKWARQHNTLVVDGKGQLGEGRTWFSGSEPLALKSRPRILRAESTPALDHISGDATEAYPKASGLRRYVRHLLFLKPDVLVVVDDIAVDRARPLELRFHPEKAAEREADGAFAARGEMALLRLEPLTPDGVAATIAEDEAAGTHGGRAGGLSAIRLSAEKAAWRNAVALSWSAAGGTPARVRLEAREDRWTFRAGDRAATLNWATGEATLQR